MKRMLFCAVAAASQFVLAQAVLPGYLTDPTALKGQLAKDSGYQPPERLKYPYVSTYYVRPTVKVGDALKVGFFVTDFDSSKIRFLDDSHRFTASLEYRLKGGESKVLTKENLKSGDASFVLEALPVGEYEMRIWAKDAKGRESHRVIHDFRVVEPSTLAIPADKVYKMTEADLAAYGIRNDGDLEKLVYVGAEKTEVVRDKRKGVPGYTVTVPLDEKTGKLPVKAFDKAQLVYDEGYDKAKVEEDAVRTSEGLQKLLDDKAASGFRKVVMLPGTYRLSHTKHIFLPDQLTLDLNQATLKQNGFTGASSCLVRLGSTIDSHLVNGTLEGDYWEHDYKGSPNNSEWPAGFEIGGDSWYSTVENVKVVDITGYGGQNGIAKDKKGDLMFFVERLPKFAPGGLNAKTGEVDGKDKYRFTTDFKELAKITEKGRRRLQVSKVLGYQGRVTRSWQMTVAWYDAEKNFISAETSWQYREMWIPENAAFLRVSVEDESADAANASGLSLTAMRIPVNCAVARCTFDHCRCVGYAASAMKNMLFAANFFTLSGECAARCAFDAEDGWDQMQDVYFLKNVFQDNPFNNSILTCAGHNFILEKNEGDVYFWGRTHSPCVRGNAIGRGTYRCDSRLRSGYGRFDDNTYAKGVELGLNEGKDRADNWDYVLSGVTFDGATDKFNIEVGLAGRMVNCTFKNMPIAIANAYACTFENCTDGSTYKAFPGGRWFEVTVKDCNFSRFYNSNNWDRCHFKNTKLNRFMGGLFALKKCDFTECSLFGLHSGNLRLSDCTFDATTIQGNYWENPSDLVFKNCKITTRDDAPFLKLGVYTIGRIGFDGCSVSGKKSLVLVSDLRPISRPPNADPATNPDNKPGAIAIRGTKWASEAKQVIDHAALAGTVSTKSIVIHDKGGNALTDGVVLIDDKFPLTWERK